MGKLWDVLAEGGHQLDSFVEQLGEVTGDAGKTLRLDDMGRKIGVDDAGKWFWREAGKPFLHGYEKAYRGITRPITTGLLVQGEDTFNPGAWADAWDASRNISPGQALTAGWYEMWDKFWELGGIENAAEPFSWIPEFGDDAEQSFEELTGSGGKSPFDIYDEEQRKAVFDHGMAKFYSGMDDFAARWYLDPTIIGGKVAKIARIKAVVRPISIKGTDAERLARAEAIALPEGGAGGKFSNSGRFENWMDQFAHMDDPVKRTDALLHDPMIKDPATALYLGAAKDVMDFRMRAVVAMDRRFALKIEAGESIPAFQKVLTRLTDERLPSIESEIRRVAAAEVHDVPTLRQLAKDRSDLLDEISAAGKQVEAAQIMYDALGSIRTVPRVTTGAKIGKAIEASEHFGGPGVSWGVYQPGRFSPFMKVAKSATTRVLGVVPMHDPTEAVAQMGNMFDRAGHGLGVNIDPAVRAKHMADVARAAVAGQQSGKLMPQLGHDLQTAVLEGEKSIVEMVTKALGIDKKDAEAIYKEYNDRRIKIRVTVENTRNQRLTAERQAKAPLDDLGIPEVVPAADDAIFSGGKHGNVMLDEIKNILGNTERHAVLASQLADNIPLLDVDLFVKVIRREQRTIKEHGAELREALTTRQRSANELVNETLDMMNRFWKPAQLLRLGWPQRVLVDEMLRAMAVMGAVNQSLVIKDSLKNSLRPGDRIVKIKDFAARGRIRQAEERILANDARAAQMHRTRVALNEDHAAYTKELRAHEDDMVEDGIPIWSEDFDRGWREEISHREQYHAQIREAIDSGPVAYPSRGAGAVPGHYRAVHDDQFPDPEFRRHLHPDFRLQQAHAEASDGRFGTAYLRNTHGDDVDQMLASDPAVIRRVMEGEGFQAPPGSSAADLVEEYGQQSAASAGWTSIGRDDDFVVVHPEAFVTEAEAAHLQDRVAEAQMRLQRSIDKRDARANAEARIEEIAGALKALDEQDPVGAIPGIVEQLSDQAILVGHLEDDANRLLGQLQESVVGNEGTRVVHADGDGLGSGLEFHLWPEGTPEPEPWWLRGDDHYSREGSVPSVGRLPDTPRQTFVVHTGEDNIAVGYLRTVASQDEFFRLLELPDEQLIREIVHLDERMDPAWRTDYIGSLSENLTRLVHSGWMDREGLMGVYGASLARSNGHFTLLAQEPFSTAVPHRGVYLNRVAHIRSHEPREDIIREELTEIFSELAEQGGLRSELMGRQSDMMETMARIEEMARQDLRGAIRPSDMLHRRAPSGAVSAEIERLTESQKTGLAEFAAAEATRQKAEFAVDHAHRYGYFPGIVAGAEPSAIAARRAEGEAADAATQSYRRDKVRLARLQRMQREMEVMTHVDGGTKYSKFGGTLVYDQGGFRVEYNDALQGVHGPMWINKTSAQDVSRALADVTQETHNRLRVVGGDTTTLTGVIPPGTPQRKAMLMTETYDRGWERAVNAQIGMDGMGRKILEGKTDDEIIDWLKNSPDGIKYFRSADTVRRANLDWWMGVARLHIDHYLPAPELKELALQGKARASDLRTWNQSRFEAQTAERVAAQRQAPGDPWSPQAPRPTDAIEATAEDFLPMIHAQSIDEVTSGTAVGKWWAGFVDKSYKYIGTLPTDVLTRQPLFAAVYRREMRANFEASGFKGNDHVPEWFMADMEAKARREALRTVKRTVYDVANASNLSHTLRYIMPFYAAWQDALQTWGRIWLEDPSIMGKMLQVWQAPSKGGTVYTDPEGRQYVNTPLPKFLKNAPFLKDMLPTGEKAGMQADAIRGLIFQGEYWYMPGFGPPVTVPVSGLVRNRPDTYDMLKPVIPYGAGDGWLDSVLPAGWKRSMAFWRKESDPDYAKAMVRISADVETARRLGDLDMDDAQALKETKRRTDALFTVRVWANFGLPFSPSFRSPYQFYIDKFRTMQEQIRDNPDAFDGRTAQDAFLDEVGDEYLAFTTAATKSNIGGIQPTEEGFDAFKQYKDLISQSPELGSLIVGDIEGTYSGEVANWMQRTRIGAGDKRTLREIRDPRQALIDQQVSRGWDQFRKIDGQTDSALRERGLISLRSKAAGDIAQARDARVLALMKQYPEWARVFGTFDRGSADRRALAMENMVNDPRILARPGYQALADYLQFRRTMSAELERRDQAGGSKNLQAQENIQLKLRWDAYIQGLKMSDTYFGDIWARWLANDDLRTGGTPL